MKNLVLFFLLIFLRSAYTQPTSDPAYANMQRAVGGIISSHTQSMGYTPSDPRSYQTLYQWGKAATATASGAGAAYGAGVLLASAPAWLTLVATSAIGAGISYAVWAGLDKLQGWYFSNGSNPVTPVSLATLKAPYSNWKSFLSNPADVSYVQSWFDRSGTDCGNYQYENLTWTESCKLMSGCKIKASGAWLSPPTAILTFPGCSSSNIQCPSGSVLDSVSLSCASSSGTPKAGTATSLTNAASQLTPATLAQPVDYQTLANLINETWRKASQEAGYAGVPYPVTNPVTSSEVESWAKANPTSYPTVAALTSSVTDSTGAINPSAFYPSNSADSGTVVKPTTSPSSPTDTNPNSGQQKIDLGPDPNIASPSLEAIPTAQQILSPLTSLFPELKSYAVPSHVGACPKPDFQVFGKSILMDQHCTILEQNRFALSAASLLAFTLLALFIVLSA